MSSPLFTTDVEQEKVFLVGIRTGAEPKAEAEASLAELTRLAGSTDGLIVGSEMIHVRSPDAATYITSGLVGELVGLFASSEASAIILDKDVSPRQQANLEKRWEIKIITRSELILDIFAARAHTSEGKLQVELAQYQFRLPRLSGQGVEMSRLAGGIGARGPGEMKLETDRRVIEKRIHRLTDKIKRLKRQRQTQRARRTQSEAPIVALVGYTNAGKSTLLNALTGSEVFVEDKLFATLDPTSRRGALASGAQAVFVDTVGFINRLPTQLAAAFRATLEEVLYADILVQVVDVTSPQLEREMRVTAEVLEKLGAEDMPRLVAWNKIDRLAPDSPDAAYYEGKHEPSVGISALQGDGVDRLLEKIEALINAERPRTWLRFNYDEYREATRIEERMSVHRRVHGEDGVYLLASVPPGLLEQFEPHVVPGPPVVPDTPVVPDAPAAVGDENPT